MLSGQGAPGQAGRLKETSKTGATVIRMHAEKSEIGKDGGRTGADRETLREVRRTKSTTTISSMIRNVRSLRVLLVHPQNREGEEIVEHLNRIGCHLKTCWPPTPDVSDGFDVVMVAVRAILEEKIDFSWNPDKPAAALIAIVDYENPLMIDCVLRLKAQSVIGQPVRPFGLMATLLLGTAKFKQEQKLWNRIDKLSTKLKASRDVDAAKLILMRAHNMSEDRAYQMMREQAMNKRMTVEEIACAIVQASEYLDFGLTKE